MNPTDLVCARCNNSRPTQDMALINYKPYCHPATSTKPTCYMKATWDESGNMLVWPAGKVRWEEIDVAKLNDRIRFLEYWQREALEVIKGWEKVWEAAGRPGQLGESKYQAMLKYIQSL